ncbi:unnamed protein product [Moneuplotes crassus]|uniref:Uncharacterized protein n=1 Tax=Euplotes crassus TaxID=5936 RepID=A0AAD1UPT3_EUPCR|nr:unnamed protein product [Moneuplotes crassus]
MEKIGDWDRKRKGRNRVLERSLFSKEKKQDYKHCCSVHYNIFGEIMYETPLDPNSGESFNFGCFYCRFKKGRYLTFIQKLRYLKFFDINSFMLLNFNPLNKLTMRFMDFSFPNNVNDIVFTLQDKIIMKPLKCFNSVIRLSSKVLKNALFYEFCFTNSQLKRLIPAYKHVRILSLEACKLSVPTVPDFSNALENSKIKKLILDESGQPSWSDWGNNLDEFKNLIQGLATSPDFKSSLDTVKIRNCQIEQHVAQEIFLECQIVRVEILTRF